MRIILVVLALFSLVQTVSAATPEEVAKVVVYVADSSEQGETIDYLFEGQSNEILAMFVENGIRYNVRYEPSADYLVVDIVDPDGTLVSMTDGNLDGLVDYAERVSTDDYSKQFSNGEWSHGGAAGLQYQEYWQELFGQSIRDILVFYEK